MYSDYKILYSPKVENKLDDFIDYMSKTCKYKDSWLYDEDLIVDNFINDIKIFIRELRKMIEDKIKSWILWQIEFEDKDFIKTKMLIFTRSYNIVCKNLLLKNKKIIVLEDIFIKT